MLHSSRFFVLLILFLFSARAFGQWTPTVGAYGAEVDNIAASGNKVYADTRAGFYRSFDRGLNWSFVSNVSGRVFAVSDTVLLRTGGYAWRSIDDGETWSQTALPSPLSFAKKGSKVFAGTSGGVYVSRDQGISWQPTFDNLSDKGISAIACSDSILIVGTNFNGAYVSSDDGVHWQQLANGIPASDHLDQIRYVAALGKDLFAITDYILTKYSWSDSTWKTCDSGYRSSIVGVSNARIITGRLDGNVYYSDDTGVSWHKGYGTSGSIMCFANADTTDYLGSWCSLFVSIDKGESWRSQVNGMKGVSVTSFIQKDSTILGVTFRNGVFASTNEGATWSFSNLWGSSSIVNAGSKLMAAYGYLITSADNGKTWNTDSTLNGVLALAANNNILVAACSNDSAYASFDTGKTWFPRGQINQYITLLKFGVGELWGMSSEGLSLSRDTGRSWSFGRATSQVTCMEMVNGVPLSYEVDQKLTNQNSSVVLADTVNALVFTGNLLFAGTNKGVFYSKTGHTWTAWSDGLQDSSVTGLGYSDKYIFAGVGGTIWRRSLADLGIKSAMEDTAPASHVLTVFPNPTPSSTTISLTPEASGYAEISIVNMLGQTVGTIYSGVLDASEHQFAWDTGKMPAPRGIYHCVVKMNGRAEAVPIVVE